MCGITGYYGINDSTTIKLMTSLLEHRGPDNFGYFTDKDVSLGHRRLSIIDLSENGKQPMSNEDETIWITYNGEIYNFQDLKQDLETKGHKFKSNTDTEVIIHAYEEYGSDCLQKLNGMFAFCIYDSNKKELFLARDRIGQKPLFYYWDGKKFIFASELKSILVTEFFEKELNPTSLKYFLSYNYIPNPHTPFKNIYKLPPSNYLILKNNNLERGSYWDLNFKEEKTPKKTSIKELTSLLKDSVEKRQMSDVPLGAFLSGGLDSSLVVALMSQITPEPIKTFTIGFENQEFDETPYAKIVSDHCNTNHTPFKVSVDCIKVLPKVVWSFDEPHSDPSAIPIYYLNQEAKGKVKVILTGDGGDEFFAGYKRYLSYTFDKYYYKFPSFIRKNLALSLLNTQKHKNKRYNFLKYAQKYISTSDLEEDQRHTERINWFSNMNGSLNSIFTENFNPSGEDAFAMYRSKIGNFDYLSKMQYLDIKSFLSDDILAKSDRMSMAHSIELRAPILDFRIADLASKLPPNFRLKGLKVKHLLNQVARPYLPQAITQRKKQGMWMPLNDWIKKDFSDILEKTFVSLDKRSILKKASAETLLAKHLKRTEDYSMQLWSLINLELFLKMYSDDFYKTPPPMDKLF